MPHRQRRTARVRWPHALRPKSGDPAGIPVGAPTDIALGRVPDKQQGPDEQQGDV
ncbi:hypothetical protein [Streptomyces sp. AC512_CC834]|uniref:hypothetical protein n=1 Tax=Streptomyces sp. AC512_CC834 TaxID=2823691 RepID=UPI001C26A120|nr:hypothetical protein [Streptomyces sp. AC512_CC834]